MDISLSGLLGAAKDLVGVFTKGRRRRRAQELHQTLVDFRKRLRPLLDFIPGGVSTHQMQAQMLWLQDGRQVVDEVKAWVEEKQESLRPDIQDMILANDYMGADYVAAYKASQAFQGVYTQLWTDLWNLDKGLAKAIATFASVEP